MFTGIVEMAGRVEELASDGAGARLSIDAPPIAGSLALGESVAVNGVCLTVTGVSGTTFSTDVVPETMRRSNLGDLAVGDRVNLERSLAADGRFAGHVVQGHVDGTGRVTGWSDDGAGKRLSIEAPADLLRYVVEKGSVCVDGISLTVAAVDESGFEIALIPHTLESTAIGDRGHGDKVNVEVDIIAKYVERLVEGGT